VDEFTFNPKGTRDELETLANLCLAYPAYSVVLLPQKQPAGSQLKPQSFIQWYIKEYLVYELIQRNHTPSLNEEESPEVTYTVREKNDAMEA
jgi:hypothetical protein